MSNLSDRKLKPISELAADRPHGDRLRYMAGCKCMLCRAANSQYETRRAAARKAGEWNGLVSTKRVLRHLSKLSQAGVGYKSVADAAGVARSIVARIKNGSKTKIRKQTEKRLLSVTEQARGDASIVPAAKTWVLINRLIEVEGMTEAEIAQRLGYKNPQLQIGKERILARTAIAVERLYRRMTR